MLRCNECGHEFYSPKIEYESRGEYWGVPAYEPVGYCPNCDGDDFEEVEYEEDEEVTED